MITAALWGDPVFEREATQAEALMRPHFGAEGRSIVLSAGAGMAPRNYPAATPNNIAAAIGQVGSLIDPNEDLVVLFITSHGAPDGTAALREHNRMFAGLRPAHLANLLNQGLKMSLPTVVRGSHRHMLEIASNKPSYVLFLHINFEIRHVQIEGFVALLMDIPTLDEFRALIAQYIARATRNHALPLLNAGDAA